MVANAAMNILIYNFLFLLCITVLYFFEES